LYRGAGPEHVLVTTGTAEANFLIAWALLDPEDEAVVMLPNYMQLPLLARTWGGAVREWWLRPGRGEWTLDVDELKRLVTSRTKAIFVCHPNNPTGAVLPVDVLNAICAAADRVGAYVIADEVYRGAERDGHLTPSFWGRYPRAIVTGGLSKAYGLPGLRVGWIVAPTDLVNTFWGYHDFTTIAPGFLSDRLALMALMPRTRQRLLARTRQILTENLRVLTTWADDLAEELSWNRPQAGAIAFFHYRAEVNSTQLVERLRREQSVLVVPGDHFKMDGYLRLGFGMEPRILSEGLSRTAAVLRSL
jgi:aspartate/methionine/tyrosine aminotransferase